MSAVVAVLDEVGTRHDDLVARIERRAEEADERRRRAHGDDDVLARERQALLLREMRGNRLAAGGNARVGAVAESERLDGLVGDPVQNRARGLGRRHVGIAEREVAYRVLPVEFLEFDPLLEHLSNEAGLPRGGVEIVRYCLHVDHPFSRQCT